jgi:hypothetical protein
MECEEKKMIMFDPKIERLSRVLFIYQVGYQIPSDKAQNISQISYVIDCHPSSPISWTNTVTRGQSDIGMWGYRTKCPAMNLYLHQPPIGSLMNKRHLSGSTWFRHLINMVPNDISKYSDIMCLQHCGLMVAF